MVKGANGPGVYSATYSNIPVYEYQFGPELKEHVMRRRHDDWINATHILKAAGFDKPARTRILEREVQKEEHEKVQGGYGKYQGTWIPLESGQRLAERNGIYEQLRMIFEFQAGDDSPPPAPKHTTNKPKAPKKPAVPKFHNTSHTRPSEDPYENMSADYNDAESPENTTIASESFMDDDRYDMSQQSTGHRKRKRDESQLSITEQNHIVYADELLDYFMLQQADGFASRPEPPTNFQPDRLIDSEGHTAMHWACSMGDLEVMKQLTRFGANLACRNIRGETPLMRAVLFTNCQDKQTMPRVVHELIGTIECVDYCQSTVIHHAAAMTGSKNKNHCARYYLDVVLNRMSETMEQEDIHRLLDMQDVDGNTACHIAAKNMARKCVRALMGRGASTDIPNNDNVTAEDLIRDLNNFRAERNLQASSSPFAPDSNRRISFQDPTVNDVTRRTVSHHSEAAMSVEMKVAPLILEKFHDLSKSFDEELNDRDNSEIEAKRILNSTHIELASIREKILELGAMEEDPSIVLAEQTQLLRAQQVIINLVEQQQQNRLAASVMREESMMNGHLDNGSPDVKLELYAHLEEQRAKRVKLVEEYTNAVSMAGVGGKDEIYRKLVNKCLGLKGDDIDGQLDSLISNVTEEMNGMNGLHESVMVD